MKLTYTLFFHHEGACWSDWVKCEHDYYTNEIENMLHFDSAADAFGYYFETAQYLVPKTKQNGYEIVEGYVDDQRNYCTRFLEDHEHDHAIERYFEDAEDLAC